MLVIYLAPLPRGFFLGTLGPFRFSLSGPMLRPRLRNLANEPLEAWPCIGLEFNFARLRFWSVGHGAGMIKPLDHDAHERERRTMHDNVVPLHSELGTPRRRTSLAPTPRPRFGAQSGRHDHIPCAQQYRDQNKNCRQGRFAGSGAAYRRRIDRTKLEKYRKIGE